MSNTKFIRNKILSIKNTKKITKAMEMIASSKKRKTQESMKSRFYYTKKIELILNHLIKKNIEYKHPYLFERKIKRICYIIISTDRGLTGNLNNLLFKNILIDINNLQNKNIEIELVLVGLKAISFFKSIKLKIIAKITGIENNLLLSNIIGPINIILNKFNKKYLDKIYIANNKFINSISQKPQIIQLIPYIYVNKKNNFIKKETWDYIYEPNLKNLLNCLLTRYIESKVYQSIMENIASEQAARTIAMKAATDNCTNLIKNLQFLYNKERQNLITKELTEIVSGAT